MAVVHVHSCDVSLCIYEWPSAPACLCRANVYRSNTQLLTTNIETGSQESSNVLIEYLLIQARMFTQALPYGSPHTTYEPIAPARTSSSSSPRKFSLHSVRSNISTNTTSTTRSNLSEKSTRIKARLHSLLRSNSKRDRKVTEVTSDSEAGSVTPLQKTRKAKKVAKNPEAERMFTWAALGAYAYPGAAPVFW